MYALICLEKTLLNFSWIVCRAQKGKQEYQEDQENQVCQDFQELM